MLGTANSVVAARSEILCAAVALPPAGDYAEIGRMVPEKLEAFSSANAAAGTVYWDMGTAWLRYYQRLGGAAFRGRAPTTAEATSLVEGWTSLMIRTFEASARLGAVSLAPVRRQVNRNAARLKAGASVNLPRKSPTRKKHIDPC
jgi:hypothetical protein